MMRTPALVTFLVTCSAVVAAQQVSPQSRAQEIAAAFTKHKSVVREKHGIRKEKYKDVRSEPVVQPDIAQYSGTYEVPDLGYVITVQARRDGTVQASGYEGDQLCRKFDLEHARIEGALLTATKVYADGAKEAFAGVFMNRTERNSPTDTGMVTFGLGVVLSTPLELGSITVEKLFYELKQ